MLLSYELSFLITFESIVHLSDCTSSVFRHHQHISHLIINHFYLQSVLIGQLLLFLLYALCVVSCSVPELAILLFLQLD